MLSFTNARVSVAVPATTANLGPGFDALGMALDLHDVLTGQVISQNPDDLTIEVEGEGADVVPRDASHLVVRAMQAAFAVLAVPFPGLSLHCRNVIPQGRGLGSSSAAIVGGIALARALVTDGHERMSDKDLFALAADIEGHPDNVAPAALGGFVISGRVDDDWFVVRSPVDARISAVTFSPPVGVLTSVSRGLLPPAVPHRDAAANSGRAALLVAALAGQPDFLLPATRDWLHQSYRSPAMQASYALMQGLRRDGIPAVISGAGPTVLALVTSDAMAADVRTRCPIGWVSRHLAIVDSGVHTL